MGMLASRFAQASSFIVEDIQVRGLQRISAGTVYNYLPVNIGERFAEEKQPMLLELYLTPASLKTLL